jgi:predicted nucleic acid-binding protein
LHKPAGVLSATIIEAIDLLDKSYLTPTESIQLAAALQLNADNRNTIFICSDKKLGRLAEKYGLKFLLIDIALAINESVYDCLFIATAEYFNLKFITDDKKLYLNYENSKKNTKTGNLNFTYKTISLVLLKDYLKK